MNAVLHVLVGIRSIIGLILPGFAAGRDFYKQGPIVRWLIRILLFVVIFVLACFVQHRWEWLNEHITNPPVSLQPFWLAGMVFCSLFIAWNVWWLWKLLTEQYENIEFPDIDLAWKLALTTLRDQRVDLAKTPIYLVLGRPAAGEDGIFKASRVDWRVRAVPAGEEEPLHVWASKEAIVITCAGASQLGALAKAIRKETIRGAPNEKLPSLGQAKPAAHAPDIRGTLSGVSPAANPLKGTLGSGNEPLAALGQGAAGGLKATKSAAAADREIRESEGGGLRGTIVGGFVRAGNMIRQSLGGKPSSVAFVENPIASFIRNHPERERQATRLRYLCRIMARELKPRCPLNGVMLLMPTIVLDKNLVGDCAAVCKQDVATVRESLQLDFVTVAVVCDVEKIPGFSEFRKAFPGDMRGGRLGSGLPLKPDLDYMKSTYVQLLENTTNLICNQTISSFVFKWLRVDSTEGKPTSDQLLHNMQLYRFLSQIQSRRPGLNRVLRSLIPPNEGAVMCGGCYFIASGQEPKEQAFIPGVFDKLLSGGFDRAIYWRKRALELDAKYRHLPIPAMSAR